ncbi:spore germination protein [Neobacillus niacini]|uniref:spore germination protein n=1 Tax=Neobacillus niacini TaxID=86668 RepID=UPI0021CAEB6A|nr:spore germination protein [Neobacillus niacini]MCM3767891.1 spore germination protein [Neobacillus niacini]
MPFQINIFNLKSNAINNNGNIDFGPIVQNSHTSNTKLIGTNAAFGDLSPSTSLHLNGYTDIDVSDQDQIANPSAPILNQI